MVWRVACLVVTGHIADNDPRDGQHDLFNCFRASLLQARMIASTTATSVQKGRVLEDG
jgi:hypothetical protein